MDTETLVHRLVEAYTSRELEAQSEVLFDPDVELVPLRAALEDTGYRGHRGVRRFAHDLDESWSEIHVEMLELEVRGEQAVWIGRVRLMGRLSGASTEMTAAVAASARGGRLVRVAFRHAAEDARRELGWET